MRVRRPLILGALAVVMLLVAGCAVGPIRRISIGDGRLGLQGASVTLPVIVECDEDWNLAFASVNVVQANGPRLAQGSGGFFNEFPGVPCTGRPQTLTVTVDNTSPWVFRRGTAAVSAEITVYQPGPGDLTSRSVEPQEIRIRRMESPSEATEVGPQPAPDPRFGRT